MRILKNFCLKNLFFFSFLICVSSSLSLVAQSTTCQKAYMIVKNAEKFHYNAKEVDDVFSEIVFNDLINTLDESGLYFTKNDIEKLEKFKQNLDNEILTKDCSFYEVLTELYKRKISYTDSLLNTFKDYNFNIDKDEQISFPEETIYGTEDELVDRWRKLLKFKILYSHFSNTDSTKKEIKPDQASIEEYKTSILDKVKCNLRTNKEYSKSIDDYIISNYLKAISHAFDPHTEYFSVEDENEFDASLSKEMQSFGFSLERNDLNELEISQVFPGGSAWKSNALNEGDILQKIETKKESFDNLECISVSKLTQIISDPSISEATFSIKKKNGQKLDVELSKEKIAVDDNIIKSYILEGDKKIGYIYLPSFYSSEDYISSVNGCANDFSKELISLKREEIEGLIIDLRNNTGGSMLEALKLAGIFVDYGSLSIIDSKDDDPQLLKDLSRGQIYKDELVILVNGLSASASELMAAALQDYNRAVIIGSKTYGKSTAQSVIPLDSYKSSLENININKESKDGYIKITMSKFYRVTGESHQKEGVIPDIILPSLYDELEFGEASSQTALEKTSIEKESYYKALEKLDIERLKSSSSIRVQESSDFIKLKELSKLIYKFENNNTVPLKYEDFKKYYSSFSDFETKKTNDKTIFKVSNNSNYLNEFSDEENTIDVVNKKAIEKIENDIHINEAYLIINELIKQ